MHETDHCNDVTPPCADCGDCAIPCACGKPIETVAQLQRAFDAAGIDSVGAYLDVAGWHVSLSSSLGSYGETVSAATLSEAIDAAIDEWWRRDD